MDEVYIGGILLSEKNYLSLRKAYREAVKEKKPEFRWQDHDWVTDFIKYVLEMMEQYSIIKPLIDKPNP